MEKIKVIYRIAEKQNKNSKLKPSWVNNENCLKNALRCFPNAEFIIFGDRLTETKELAQKSAHKFFETKAHGNAESFLEVMNYAIENFDNDDIIYFLEDDYIHRPGAEQALIEGLEIADYVSLYDHLDRYTYKDGGDVTFTKSTHWRYITSTTMTFGCKLKDLIFDYQIFEQHSKGYKVPQDYYIFKQLVERGKKLVSPIPGLSTHGESNFMSPVIDWERQSFQEPINPRPSPDIKPAHR